MRNPLYDALIAPRARSEAPFLLRRDAGTLSFADLAGLAARLAHRLVESGLGPGDRVVVQAEKSVEMVALYLASIQAGGVFLPLNPAYTRAELGYFVTDAEARILVCDPAAAAALAPLAEETGARLLTLGADGGGTLTRALDALPARFDTVAARDDTLAALLYTSGTTGRSKGAMMSHENLLSNARVLVDHWRITEADTLIHALPIFHTHGLFVALNTALLAGARVRFLRQFDTGLILEALPRSTLLMGVPTFYTRLLSDPRLTRESTAAMRLFISGSAPLLSDTHAAFTARTGHAILERYGMTETNMITSNPYEGERRAGTVGQPLPGIDLRLSDPETGAIVTGDAVGMVELRGPNVFQGYWRMPEKTAAEMREDGYFVTGDLGQMSADGYLSIVGRAKDLIITGGYNVYPKEVEDVLNAVDGVRESAVFGVPDADFGEAIVAALVVEPGAEPAQDALMQAVAQSLARYKHPRRFETVEALPRNAMGKVQKTHLRDRFSAPGA